MIAWIGLDGRVRLGFGFVFVFVFVFMDGDIDIGTLAASIRGGSKSMDVASGVLKVVDIGFVALLCLWVAVVTCG